MKRIVLLGANGQLGADIRRVMSDVPDCELIPVVRHDLDISQLELIQPFLRGLGRFDYLINCTSYHKTDECEDYSDKAYTANALAPWEMAKYCNRNGSVLIHFTTDYVFSGDSSVPYKEEDAPGPLNVYGISKVSGEHYIRAYHDRYFIFRVSSLFGVTGASGKGGNFVELMIKLARQGTPLEVVDDQRMSPTHTLDIAKAVMTFINQEIEDYGIYHCSGEGECSWYEFAAEIFGQMGLIAGLTPVSSLKYKTKAKRPRYSVLDNGRINAIFPMPHWKDSLRTYLSLKGHLPN